jgi:3-oxoacyl-[acyl-carrier protein] reductase
MNEHPNGRNTVVVGASSSVGRAVVEAFAGAGDRVLATFRTPSAPPAEREVAWVQLDITDAGSRSEFAGRLASLSGGVDVLILLPGVIKGLALAEYPEAAIEEVMSVNFTSQAHLVKAALPHFSDSSQILLMGSVSGQRGSFDPVYAASKGAIVAFAKSLATWLAPRIRVNVLSPSLIEGSSMWQSMVPDRREFHRTKSPTGRLVSNQEIAKIMLDITQPHWRDLNGAVVSVNGGSYV